MEWGAFRAWIATVEKMEQGEAWFRRLAVLMKGGDSMKKNSVLMKMLTTKVTVYLNMLGSLMGDIVMSNLKSTSIVTI